MRRIFLPRGVFRGAAIGVLKPKALAMSIWVPTNGVMCFALPVCSIHLIERISSRISRLEEKSLCRSVAHMCRTYELRMRPTKRSSVTVRPYGRV